MSINISRNLEFILHRIREAERRFQRSPGSVALLAVSKMQPISHILTLAQAGQTAFGENYLQEALPKMAHLGKAASERSPRRALIVHNGGERAQPTQPKFKLGRVSWHYIGRLQSNKVHDIAKHFDWVHTVTRLSEATILSQARSSHKIPLQVCIQVKLDDNPSKPGIILHEVEAFADNLVQLPHVQLRGLMAMPPYSDDVALQRHYFATVRIVFETLQNKGLSLDTLSMGTTHDLEAAIAEGATLVRIGTGLFGLRKTS